MFKKASNDETLEKNETTNLDTTETKGNSVDEISSSDSEELFNKLEQELQAALEAKEELHNRLLRNQADFENYRRRTRLDIEQLSVSAGEDLVKKILPVLDSLERAVNSFAGENGNVASWQEGVALTLKQFQSIMAAEGLEPVAAIDQVFDPQVHEAVMQEESDSVTEPMVEFEMQKGYKFRGKLLRPALVKVAVPQQ